MFPILMLLKIIFNVYLGINVQQFFVISIKSLNNFIGGALTYEILVEKGNRVSATFLKSKGIA